MAIIKCPECGHDVSDKAPFCPNCGYTITGKTEPRNVVEPIDDSWLEKYRRKAKLVKINQFVVNGICLVLFVSFLCLWLLDKEAITHPSGYVSYYHKEYWFTLTWGSGLILLTATIASIMSIFVIKTKVFNVDGYNVVAYLGFFKNILVVENVFIDSVFASTFHSVDIFAKLPNGKKIIAKYSFGSATIIEND